MLIAGIVIAGAFGAITRYLVDRTVQSRTFGLAPVGILVVNVSGSLLLGFITGLALYHALPDTPRTILGTGFCGAYTTFSTFTFETLELADARQTRRAVGNVLASLTLPVFAAALGLAIAAL